MAPLGPDHGEHSITSAALPSITVSTLESSGFRADIASAFWTLCLVRTGTLTVTWGGETRTLKAGQSLLSPPGRAQLTTSRRLSLVWTRFNPNALQAATAPLVGSRSRIRPVSIPRREGPDILLRVNNLVIATLEALAQPDISAPLRNRLVTLYDRMVVLETAAALTTTTDDVPAPAGTGRVALAETFMAGNFASAIGPSEIAAAARMSVRALQYAFRKAHGITPSDYLRGIRLDHARRGLSQADSDTRITDVAFESGFNNLGNFYTHYLARYGETPAETIRKSGRRDAKQR